MDSRPRGFASRAAQAVCAAMPIVLLAACSAHEPKEGLAGADSKEFFAESEYQVAASPRAGDEGSDMRRGGGREKIGKPYKVKGKWYRPAEDPDYRRVGAASWYGDAFHGRLTANGEVYDMAHLTAAHPTMPLPSYARVTNQLNGRSLVVRVNDRGPFARGRIIDLSKQAARMLDYTDDGVAEVEVEYVGRAPLHGRDDEFLMASYEPGDDAGGDGGAVPGTLLAMNETSPETSAGATAFDGQRQPGDTVLPDTGPLVPDRPEIADRGGQGALQLLSYAGQPDRHPGARAFDRVVGANPAEKEPERSRQAGDGPNAYVAAGTWSSRKEAERQRAALDGFGRAAVKRTREDDGTYFVLTVHPDGRDDIDRVLEAAWAAGADGAFVVRD